MAKDKTEKPKVKILILGTVVKIEPSGMVVLDDGTRSNTKAQIGDVLKRNSQNGEITVEKGEELLSGSVKQIADLEQKISDFEKEVEALREEILAKDEVIKTLQAGGTGTGDK
jgi:TolA-binding protein